jgi:hypothetical protein
VWHSYQSVYKPSRLQCPGALVHWCVTALHWCLLHFGRSLTTLFFILSSTSCNGFSTICMVEQFGLAIILSVAVNARSLLRVPQVFCQHPYATHCCLSATVIRCCWVWLRFQNDVFPMKQGQCGFCGYANIRAHNFILLCCNLFLYQQIFLMQWY